MSYCGLHMRHIGRFGQIGPKRRSSNKKDPSSADQTLIAQMPVNHTGRRSNQ